MLVNRPITPLLNIERHRGYPSEIAYSVLTGMEVVTPLEGSWRLAFLKAGRRVLVLAPELGGNRVVFEMGEDISKTLPENHYQIELSRTVDGESALVHRAAFSWVVGNSSGLDSVPVPPDLVVNIVSVAEFQFVGQVYIPGGTQLTAQDVRGLASDLAVMEPAVGNIDGANAVFGTSFPYDPDFLQVHNGILLSPGDDYTFESSTSVRFTTSPQPGEKIFFIYNKLTV